MPHTRKILIDKLTAIFSVASHCWSQSLFNPSQISGDDWHFGYTQHFQQHWVVPSAQTPTNPSGMVGSPRVALIVSPSSRRLGYYTILRTDRALHRAHSRVPSSLQIKVPMLQMPRLPVGQSARPPDCLRRLTHRNHPLDCKAVGNPISRRDIPGSPCITHNRPIFSADIDTVALAIPRPTEQLSPLPISSSTRPSQSCQGYYIVHFVLGPDVHCTSPRLHHQWAHQHHIRSALCGDIHQADDALNAERKAVVIDAVTVIVFAIAGLDRGVVLVTFSSLARQFACHRIVRADPYYMHLRFLGCLRPRDHRSRRQAVAPLDVNVALFAGHCTQSILGTHQTTGASNSPCPTVHI